jgi:hypothetical protein
MMRNNSFKGHVCQRKIRVHVHGYKELIVLLQEDHPCALNYPVLVERPGRMVRTSDSQPEGRGFVPGEGTARYL